MLLLDAIAGPLGWSRVCCRRAYFFGAVAAKAISLSGAELMQSSKSAWRGSSWSMRRQKHALWYRKRADCGRFLSPNHNLQAESIVLRSSTRPDKEVDSRFFGVGLRLFSSASQPPVAARADIGLCQKIIDIGSLRRECKTSIACRNRLVPT